MKSPTGNSRDTIIRNLRNADNQARRAIVDLGRTDMKVNEVVRQAREYWSRDRSNSFESVWVLPHDVRDHFTMER